MLSVEASASNYTFGWALSRMAIVGLAAQLLAGCVLYRDSGSDVCTNSSQCHLGLVCNVETGKCEPPADAAPEEPAADAAPEPDAGCSYGHAECNGDMSDWCETNILHDIHNCGLCDHECTEEETCQGGHCVYDTVFVAGQTKPGALVVDESYLYWRTGNWQDELDNTHFGTLDRAPFAGGSPELLLDEVDYPDNLTVDETHLYWSQNGGSVWRMEKGGGVAEMLVGAGAMVRHIVVNSDRVYYWRANSAELGSVAKDGSDPQTLEVSAPVAFTVDDDFAYWVEDLGEDSYRTMRRALDGLSASEQVGTMPGGPANGLELVATPTSLYQQRCCQSLSRAPLAGGTFVNVFHTGVDDTILFAVDADAIYVLVDLYVTGLELWRAPLEPGEAAQMLSGGGSATSMAVGPEFVYWTTWEFDNVYRYPKAGP